MAYFKQTTRNILTQQEKDETIDAVWRAISYLNDKSKSNPMPEFNSINDFPASFTYFRNVMPYMSRSTILIKGSTQPKRFYRQRRKREMYWESLKIAKETGADVRDINERFNLYMHEFLYL